ncbi:MAG TPA: amylo-alpha-1,6-glucosidase [Magnetospirillaceae bacterium]|nr:amylo-alpha-1,6-glucosidase [Magnetospirillaceae bacterium]
MPGQTVTYRPHHRALPVYSLGDENLGVGPSFGNSAAWINTKGSGAIERVFSVELGESCVGAVGVRYGGYGRSLRMFEARQALHDQPFVGLRQDAPGEVEIHPAYVRRRFSIGGAIDIMETVFLPVGSTWADPPIAYYAIELHNRDTVQYNLRVVGSARLRGDLPGDITARYDKGLQALIAANKSMPDAVRIFALSRPPDRFAATFDFGSMYEPSHVDPLPDSTEATGDVLGALQLDLTLNPDETYKLGFAVGAYARGESDAIAEFKRSVDYEGAFERTVHYFEEELQRGDVLTPDPAINAGALWGKANMRRVMAAYPQGLAFTNDPGVSSNIVIRDAAWFVYGCDHFMPHFSRQMLDKIAQLQYGNGKLPEYWDGVDGHREDYGLNINDDTPLFVLAVNHHYRSTGDLDWLRRVLPSVAKAARYIMSQADERGLIHCTADDPRGDVWAIASWRNIVPGYTLNGAVTEINAECAAALRAAAHLVENAQGDASDAQTFRAASDRVRAAMDAHLRNPENGLYYLNVDAHGNIHTDVTGDEVFPVMFRVCDEETGFRVISRLNSPDFWTEAGLRTVSRQDPLYDPSGNFGLLGGVWPGLSWWYAFAAARYYPDVMVNALRSSTVHYTEDPKAKNTVPGQFSEWFDGESLVNRGMRLSPWEPPRFLWAAVEGICGFMCSVGKPRINPLVPAAWKWLGLRRLPYHGAEITYFAARQHGKFHVYATTDFDTEHEGEVYAEDVSSEVTVFSEAAAVVALRRPGEIIVLIGNVGTQTTAVPFNVSRVIDARKDYQVRIYDSERDAWEEFEGQKGDRLISLAMSVETHGYRLIQLLEQT